MIAQLTHPRRERIAIIGSGISGLVCAEQLHRDFDITVFEAADYIGGHTNTVDVDIKGEHHSIDTGFIVYNETNYPRFSAMLERLGVATQPTSMSFSVRCDQTGLEYNGTSLNTLFAQRRNLLRPRFHRMVRDILRFNRQSLEVLDWSDADMTVSEYAAERDFSDSFVRHYLVPMGAALWSCPPGLFRQFPIRFVVEFMNNHAMLQLRGRPQWRVIGGGSQQYVRALTEPFQERIRLRTPVVNVRRAHDHVDVITDRFRTEPFDHVIFACHSDQALAILDDPAPVERELLSVFPYQSNEAVLHTDESRLPRNRRAWAAWNYHLPASSDDGVDHSTVTYNMNRLQSLVSQHTFLVTLNETDLIDPNRVLERITYHHPLYTTRRDSAQARHHELINRDRTSFCGAYWGFGFHEDGVRSALRVCESFTKVPA